ncbi:MAG: dihydroorotate dehydrogenase electron transfer subunit [Acidobacteria bacterium]|nr:dihydroorotate dehydrogenase electron transfer subunit [Acidobacteriota bacterium]
MPPVDVRAAVISNVRLSPDYNVLTIAAPEVGALTEPGQFVMLKTTDASDPMLRRPFSVFEVLRDDLGTVRAISILNKRAGRTTGLLYGLEAGDPVWCLGPLGLPFNPPTSGEAWMVAGGVGLAPFATLAEALVALNVPTTLFYGARTSDELYYLEFFDRLGVKLVLTTEDGGLGVKGRVTGPLAESLEALGKPNLVTVYACGPEPMLAAVAKLAARHGQPSEVSMERTMGCGLGGCYSCVVPVIHADQVTRYVRSCIGGPVFDGATVAWE